jgi:hypothetical protein
MANHTGDFFRTSSILPLQVSCPFAFPSPSVIIMDVQKKMVRRIRHQALFEGDIVKTSEPKACAVTRFLVCWQQRLFANSLSRGDRDDTQLPSVHAYIANFLRSYILEGATATKVPLLVQFVISNTKFDLKI